MCIRDSQNSFGLGEDRSGVLFLIDMENRLPHISTTGMAIRYFTDSRLNAILDSCYDDLSNGDYAGAASVVIQQSLQYYQSDIPEDQYNYDTETGEISVYEEPVPHFPNRKVILIFVLISFAVGLIFCGSVCGKYRMHLFEYKYPFRQKSNFSLSQKEDVFYIKMFLKPVLLTILLLTCLLYTSTHNILLQRQYHPRFVS